MTIDNIINSPLGTQVYREEFEDINQKEFTKLMSAHGWRKDTAISGRWYRVTLWKYYTFWEGKSLSLNQIVENTREHLKDKKTVCNKDVHLYAGLALNSSLRKTVMQTLGYNLVNHLWIKEDSK